MEITQDADGLCEAWYNSSIYLLHQQLMEDGMIILYNGFNNAPIHTYHLDLKALQFHQLDLVLYIYIYVCDCFDILVFLVLSSCTFCSTDIFTFAKVNYDRNNFFVLLIHCYIVSF